MTSWFSASWDSTYRWYPLYFKVLIHHSNSYQAAELAAVTLQWSCERKRSQPAPWRSFASRASRAHRVCIHNRQGPNQHALWNVWRRQESRIYAARRCERRIHTRKMASRDPRWSGGEHRPRAPFRDREWSPALQCDGLPPCAPQELLKRCCHAPRPLALSQPPSPPRRRQPRPHRPACRSIVELPPTLNEGNCSDFEPRTP